MKSKQATALTAKDKADIARIKRTREAGDEEIKRYNDSIRATPEYAKLKAHQARMAQMDKNDVKNEVTVYNKTGKDIYFVKESSRNLTKISSGSSVKLDCSKDYYYTYDANDGVYGGRSNLNASIGDFTLNYNSPAKDTGENTYAMWERI